MNKYNVEDILFNPTPCLDYPYLSLPDIDDNTIEYETKEIPVY